MIRFDHAGKNGVKISKTSLDVCHKPWLLEQAKFLGLHVPKTWMKKENISKFPVFYKEEYEAGGGIRGVAKYEDELPDIEDKQLIYQEYIDSKGTYSVGFWSENGEIKESVSHFEEYSLPAIGGSAVSMTRIGNKTLHSHVEKLLKGLNYTGWGLAEFKFCPKRNDFVLMEINSKIWASIEFSLRNNPELAKCVLGVNIEVEPTQDLVFFDNFVKSGNQFIADNLHLLKKTAGDLSTSLIFA